MYNKQTHKPMKDLSTQIEDLSIDEIDARIAELEAQVKETNLPKYLGQGRDALTNAVMKGIECTMWVGLNRYKIIKRDGYTEAIIIDRKLKSEAKSKAKYDTKYNNVYEYLAVHRKIQK
tara:strand:+ start:111 stop:467 length:357 start_codon:yes stop_codon:yes gene_type:complete